MRSQDRAKALLISYHFPPDGVIGAVRPYQLARYLPESGIDVWVLTVEPTFAEQSNVDLTATGVPSDRILRTRVDKTLRDRVLEPWRRQSAAPVPAKGAHPPRRARPFRIVRDSVLDWLAFPDPRAGWYGPALREARRAIAAIGFDVILATSPPRIGALVAHQVSGELKIPWILDLRDPWQMHWGSPSLVSPILRKLQQRLFERCVLSARLVVHNTEQLRALTSRLVPAAASRTAFIPNGIEPHWLAPQPEAERDAFRVGYYGNIMGNRSADVFLDGLHRWLQAKGDATRTRVTFVGDGLADVSMRAHAIGLAEVVTVQPPVPRAGIPRLMARDYVLLLLANDQPAQIPGKAYDYLASRRRILALTEPDSATADLLNGVEGCAVVSTPEAVARALDRYHADFQSSAASTVDRESLLSEIAYPNRVRRYAELLRSTTDS
jgi:glycosyltransferase involved in cell wall biosynthesis